MPAKKDTSGHPADEQNVHTADARTLRGLAHPLRLRLPNALREFGPATATASGLADRLGEPSGATSYHLRQPASYGLAEDDPERGEGRERWWRAVHTGTAFDTGRVPEGTEGTVTVRSHVHPFPRSAALPGTA